MEIRITTDGGSVSSAVVLVDSIRGCQGIVTGILACDAHSAGSMIFLACHMWDVSPHAGMMIHSISYGTGGKAKDVEVQVEFMKSWRKTAINDYYKTFLTRKEIKLIDKGDEMWFNASQIEERLVKLIKRREKELEE